MGEGSLRAGDSIHEIISTYSGLVYRLACARTGQRADAEDVFQEVFLRYVAARPDFHDAEHAKAWMIRTTVNVSINMFKSAWRRLCVPVDSVPERAAGEERGCEALRRALLRLGAGQRICIHLYYYEDMTAEEIAKVLEIEPATVRSRLSRGRAKLRGMLSREGDWNDAEDV